MNLGRISRRHLLQGSAALTLGTAFGIKVIEKEKVPETDAVEKTMESMINLDGATLLFPTSFGYYNPHMIKMANKFPKLHFEHCGGLWSEKDPKNAGSYFGYIDEAQYISGIVAGYTSKTGKLGFVAAKPIPQVLRNINAFTLGAKLANPKATTQVIFTGDWSMPVKEAEATNSLIDQGVVTGAEWNWEALYPKFVKMIAAGEAIPNFYRGGLKEEIVKCSPYGEAVSAEARKHADDIKAKLIAGDYVIFKGPIMDNKGKAVIAAGTDRGQKDPELEKMDYLVEGVIGATS